MARGLRPTLLPMRRQRRRPASSGFTLLEITVAMLIFFLIVSFAFVTMSDSVDQSLGAERARELRMLAERKLGEIAVFEGFHDTETPEGDFSDLPEEIRQRYEKWTWKLEVRDVTVFGTQKDEAAAYLFEAPADAKATTDPAGSATDAASAKKGETQVLRELVLTISGPAEEGSGETLEVVTYLPQVAAKAAAAAGAGGAGK